MPFIAALSQVQAEAFTPGADDILISIATPPVRGRDYPQPVLCHWSDDQVLRMWFHDCDPDYTYGVNLVSMAEEDARRIVDFIRGNPNKNVYVHCWAGKSRSYTITRFLEKNFGYEPVNSERDCHINYWVWYCLMEALDPAVL